VTPATPATPANIRRRPAARHARTRRRLAAAGAVCLALAAAAPAAAASGPVQMEITLLPQEIGIDETATLSITAQGNGFDSMRFQPTFKLDNLAMAGGASQFEDLNLINGNLTRSFRFAIQLRALAPGPARVHEILVRLGGRLSRLPDQEVHVVQEAAAASPSGASGAAGAAGAAGASGAPTPGAARGSSAGGAAREPLPRDPAELFERLFGGSPFAGVRRVMGPPVFLRAEVVPPRPLAGEQALYTVYLYTRESLAAINATAMPAFRGFWVRDLPQPEHLTREMVTIGNDSYARVAMIRKALFALRPGHHQLEPAACDVVIEAPDRGLFGLAQPPASEELHLQTPELAVDVQPLPQPPPGFGGLVGNVSLRASLQPYSLTAGQGAALTVTLAGAGNLQGVAAPSLEVPPGLTVFPPQQQSEDHLDGTTVAGRRTWTYVVVPDRAGTFSVRPRGIPYFDAARREYRTAESPPLALTALAPPHALLAAGTAGAGGADGAASHRGGAAAARRGLLAWPAWAAPLGSWAGLAPWLALPWFLILAVVLVRQRHAVQRAAATAHGAAAATPGGAAATGGVGGAAARDGALDSKLQAAAREERPRHAAASVEDGWRGYLAARWGVPAMLPPARWGAALAAAGAPPAAAAELDLLSEDLHYLRHAPQLSTTASVRDELLARSRRLLRLLR
jgi:hypothetical protein